ncbi:hypothetical protein [Pseudomonas fluorescens group sp. PF-69]
MELVDTSAPDTAAGVALNASPDAVGLAVADPAAAAGTSTALVAENSLSAGFGLAAVAAAAAPAAAVAPVAAAPTVDTAPVAASIPALGLAPLDSDGEGEDRDELESLSALAAPADMFVGLLKNLVSFAMDLGHDFETAFDAAAIRAQAMVAPKQ